MTGQPIYERNGSILCARDYQRLSGPQVVPNTHSQPQRQWRQQRQHGRQQQQQQHYRPYNQQVCIMS